jgi:hypothetical protein
MYLGNLLYISISYVCTPLFLCVSSSHHYDLYLSMSDICISVYFFISPSPSLCVYRALYLSLHLSISPSLYLSLHLSISLYRHLSMSVSIYVCIYLCLYLSRSLSISLSRRLYLATYRQYLNICNAGFALHDPVKPEANIIGNPIDAKCLSRYRLALPSTTYFTAKNNGPEELGLEDANHVTGSRYCRCPHRFDLDWTGYRIFLLSKQQLHDQSGPMDIPWGGLGRAGCPGGCWFTVDLNGPTTFHGGSAADRPRGIAGVARMSTRNRPRGAPVHQCASAAGRNRSVR